MDAVSRGESPRAEEETLRPDQLALERLALGLRTAAGVDLERLEEDLVRGFRRLNAGVIDDLLERGLARMEEERLILTLQGLAVADRVAALFDLRDGETS